MKFITKIAFVCLVVLGFTEANAQCGPLSTPDLTNNGQDGIMFDIVAINPVIVTSLDMDFDAGTKDIEIYTKAGTHVGFQANAAAWTFVGTVNVVTAGLGVHTVINIPLNEFICPGNTSAFYVTSPDGGCNYSNGVAVGNVLAADANMQILTGTGKDHLFGGSFQPRSPNVTAHYTCPPPAGPPANAGPDQVICSTTATMAASAGGVWTVIAGTGTFSNVNDPNATVTGLSPGLNQFQWSTACPTTIDVVNITVSAPPTVTVPVNATYCPGDLVPASAYTSNPAGGTYTWTNSNTAIGLGAGGAGSAPGFTATNATGAAITGTITVTPTLNGCIGTPVAYTITVDPTPTVTVPANATYCPGVAVPAGGYTSTPAGATFTWTNSNTAIGLGAGGAGSAPGFTATNATGSAISGTITVTPTLNGCVGTPVNYTITVDPTPVAPTATSVTICPNNSTTLTATAPGGTYEWYDAAVGGTLLFTGASFTTPVLVANTSYWVQSTINGCTGPRTLVTVTIAAAISVNAGLDDVICNGQSYNLLVTPNGAGYSYLWDEPANLGFSTLSNPTVSPSATTTYTVTVTDPSNCVGTDQVTITVNPVPTVTVPANATYCDGDPVPVSAFTSTPAGGTFTWTNSDPSIGLAANGTGNTPAFNAVNAGAAPVTSTITVTPTLAGCVGTPVTYTITVNPIPVAPTAADVTICVNNTATLTATAPGGTYEWYDAAVGGTLLFTGASYTTPVLAVTTSYWVQTTVNGCVSPRTMVTVTIAAAISVNAGLDDTICDGQAYNLSVNPNGAGYTYLWDEPANLGFSTLFNPSVSPTATTTYTVTVTDASNCFGSDMVTIYVNPIPTATVDPNATYCNGDPVPASVYSTTPAGGTFDWTNSDPSIGLAAAGTGNTPTFNAVNAGATPVTSTITVTPIVAGCVGTPVTYTITVNPIPTATVTANATYCNGDPVPASAYTSAPAGGTFDWTNSDPSIGLAAAGTGNTPTFNAVNAGATPVTSTITVTPTVNGCLGTPSNYTITVNPTPTATVTANASYCNGDPVPASAYTSTPAGGTFDWTNSTLLLA